MFALPVLTGLGGALAGKIIGKPQDVKLLQEKEKQLRKLVIELEKVTKVERAGSLEKETQLAEKEAKLLEALRQAEELRKRFEELQAAHHCAVEELQLQKDQFQSERELAAAKWVEESGKWEARQAALIAEKDALANEVDTLKLEAEEHAEEIAGFQKQLEDLRSRVASIVTNLLESKINKEECTKMIRELGCEITYLEAPKAVMVDEGTQVDRPLKHVDWTGQPQALLLEDREKLESLVMRVKGAGDARTLPVITFPSTSMALPPMGRPDLAGFKLRLPGAGMGTDGGAMSTRRLTDMSTDVTSKDQTTSTSRPVIIQSGSTPKKGSKPAAPQVSTKGLSFSYSVQGSGQSQFVARVPVAGSQAGLPPLSGGMPDRTMGLHDRLANDVDFSVSTLSLR